VLTDPSGSLEGGLAEQITGIKRLSSIARVGSRGISHGGFWRAESSLCAFDDVAQRLLRLAAKVVNTATSI